MGFAKTFLFVVTATAIGACGVVSCPSVAHAASAQSGSIKANDAVLEQCRAKLKAAAALGLLTNMGYDGGRPAVEVGPIWYKVDFSTKEGLARTAACFFLAGDTSSAIRFDITDNMTGKVIATWSYNKLKVK